MKLHTLTLSPNGRKVESLVAYLGLNVEQRQVDLRNGEQRSADFLALNPNGKIPVLEDGDTAVWESNAILTYLALKHPDRGLLPKADDQKLVDIQQWLFWQTAHFGPAMGKLLFEKVIKQLLGAGDPDPEAIKSGTEELTQFCAVLDQQLAGKEYICGNLSIVEFAMGPWADCAPMIGFSYAEYPNLEGWLKRVNDLNGWVGLPPLPPS